MKLNIIKELLLNLPFKARTIPICQLAAGATQTYAS
jgi:hypothetical protein